MAVNGVGSLLRGIFDALFRPRQFVESQTSSYGGNRVDAIRRLRGLSAVYLVNLFAYAAPLTLAGVGIGTVGAPPPGFATLAGLLGLDPTAAWRLLGAFTTNCLYITLAAILTLLTFHTGIRATGSSRGVLQSVHTVVYSTSAYLAAIFTGVWFLTNHAGFEGARTFVRNLQSEFVYVIIDAMAVDLELPGGRPDTLLAGEISTAGQWMLALLVVAVLYYFVSLYFGARTNHLAERGSSTIGVTAVAISPVVYVVGSVAMYGVTT